jgi:predicted ester cyclase
VPIELLPAEHNHSEPVQTGRMDQAGEQLFEGGRLDATDSGPFLSGRVMPDAVQANVQLMRGVWNHKALGSLYSGYASNVTVHTSGGDHYGRDAVVERAVQTLAAFPDLQIDGEEVLWRESGEELHISHRLIWSGHHLGHGVYGPPTGKPVQRCEISQRRLIGGRVVEEWIVHDELAVIRQLGLDEVEYARTAAQHDSQQGRGPQVATSAEVVRQSGQAHPPLEIAGDARQPAELPNLLYGLVWNARMLNLIRDYYAPDAVIWVPGNRRLEGHADLSAYILGLLAAFPDGTMFVEDVCWLGDPQTDAALAVRWVFRGHHRGQGMYGAPTDHPVHVPGLSHFALASGLIVREQMVWDELELLKQVYGRE